MNSARQFFAKVVGLGARESGPSRTLSGALSDSECHGKERSAAHAGDGSLRASKVRIKRAAGVGRAGRQMHEGAAEVATQGSWTAPWSTHAGSRPGIELNRYGMPSYHQGASGR